MNKNKYLFLTALILTAVVAFFIQGCGGSISGSAAPGEEKGSYVLSVAWPGSAEASRIIPDGAETIRVTITGAGLDEGPIISSITSAESTLLVNDVPAGNKVALIEALDESSQLLSQRKESFTIQNGRTFYNNNVPLGVAIVEGAGTEVVFQPDSIEVQQGEHLYFQNWTDKEVTAHNSGGGDIVIPGMQLDDTGKWIYHDSDIEVTENVAVSAGTSNCAVTIKLLGYWQIEEVDDGKTYYCTPGISFDSSGKMYLCYSNSENKLRYAESNNPNPGWTLSYVYNNTECYHSSMVMKSAATPYCAYGLRPSGQAESVRLSNKSGGSWSQATLFTATETRDYIKNPNIVFDGAGKPCVSFIYYDYSGTWSRNIKMMCYHYVGANPVTDQIDNYAHSQMIGTPTQIPNSIANDPATGYPCVVHGNSFLGGLKFNRFNGTTWATTVIDAGASSPAPSLAFQPGTNYPYISYYISPDLKIAKYNGSTWEIENFASGGSRSSIAFDSNANPCIAYVGTGSILNYARYNGSSWTTSFVDNNVSLYNARGLVFTSDGRPVIIYQDKDNNKVKVAQFILN